MGKEQDFCWQLVNKENKFFIIPPIPTGTISLQKIWSIQYYFCLIPDFAEILNLSYNPFPAYNSTVVDPACTGILDFSHKILLTNN